MQDRKLHLHVSSSSSDCDGRMDSEHVEKISIYEWAGFEVVGAQDPSVTTEYGEMGLRSVRVYARTDEGYNNREALECDDETCDLGAYSKRDHEAEKAGY